MQHLQLVKEFANTNLSKYEPWKVAVGSFAVSLALSRLYTFVFEPVPPLSLKKRIKSYMFSWIRLIPPVKRKIDREVTAAKKSMSVDMLTPKPDEFFHSEMPEDGISKDELMQKIDYLSNMSDCKWDRGRVSGCFYGDGDPEFTKLLGEVATRFSYSNPLHFELFPGLRKMESEVITWVSHMWNAPVSAGCMTSGGTESIMMAVLAYRNQAYARGVKWPELVAPVSAHPAFDKACHYFSIKIVHVPVDPITGRAIPKLMRKAITKNTIALIGSCPSFPWGVIDPIEEIASIANYYGIGCHVDSCLGGFIIPFLEKSGFGLGFNVDFRVRGVTSVSCDTHKYGYAPKGSSILLYRSKDLRKYQYFVQDSWPGGIYASPTVSGSRSGSVIASCWSSLILIGKKKFIKRTKNIMTVKNWIEEQIRSISQFTVLGNGFNLSTVIAWDSNSNQVDIWRVYELMKGFGWHLNHLQYPSAIHLCVTLMHTKKDVAQEFINDLKKAVEICLENPEQRASGGAALYGASQQIPDRSIIDDLARSVFDALYEENSSYKN